MKLAHNPVIQSAMARVYLAKFKYLVIPGSGWSIYYDKWTPIMCKPT